MKKQKKETEHYNVLHSGEGVGRSRPTATTIGILNRRQLPSGLKSLQF